MSKNAKGREVLLVTKVHVHQFQTQQKIPHGGHWTTAHRSYSHSDYVVVLVSRNFKVDSDFPRVDIARHWFS